MNNTEKEQLAVKAFYYTKASELGFREANKLVQYFNDFEGKFVDPIQGNFSDLYRQLGKPLRIKPTKVTTTVAVWVNTNIEVEHEEGEDPLSTIPHTPTDGFGLTTTKDMVLIERDKLQAMYTTLRYSCIATIYTNGWGLLSLEDIKNQYNL